MNPQLGQVPGRDRRQLRGQHAGAARGPAAAARTSTGPCRSEAGATMTVRRTQLPTAGTRRAPAVGPRILIAAGAAALAGLGLAAGPPAAVASPLDAPYDVLVFSKTAGLPARLDPARHPGDPRPRRGQQLHRHRDRGRRRVHRGEPRPVRGGRLPLHHRRRAQRHPADGVRVVHRAAAAATSACTPPPTPSTTGRSTATWSARTSPRTRRSSRPRSGSRTAATRPPRTCRRPGRAPTSGTTTAPTPAHRRTCSPRSTSRRTPAAAWAATTRSPGARRYDGGRSFYTGARPHRRQSYARAGLPRPPARRHPVRRRAARRPTAARRPATRRSTTARTDRLVAGRAGQLHQRRRHADLGRRHGPVLVPAARVHVVLAEAGLADWPATTTPASSSASRRRPTRGRR